MFCISNFHGSVLWDAYSSNSAVKKSIDCGIFAITYATEILHCEKVWNSSCDITLICEHVNSLVCLQLEKCFAIFKDQSMVLSL